MENTVNKYISIVAAFITTASMASVDSIWNAAPPSYDTTWIQGNSGGVTQGQSSTGKRTLLFSGRSASATVTTDPSMTMLYLSFDLDGRGVTQVMFDIEEAVGRGNVRLYNRGGENADRPYDALIRVSRIGNSVTLRGEGIWTGAPVLYTVVGYSF